MIRTCVDCGFTKEVKPRRPCESWRCDFCYQKHYNQNLRKPRTLKPVRRARVVSTVRRCRECKRPATEHDSKGHDFRCSACRTKAWREFNRQPSSEIPGEVRTCAGCQYSEPRPLRKPKHPPREPWLCRSCAAKLRKGAGHGVTHPPAKCSPELAEKIAKLMLTPHGAERLKNLWDPRKRQEQAS